MTLLPPRGERALPVLAGVLLALAFPPAAFLLPSLIALAPLLVFIEELPRNRRGRWAATRAALLTGTVFFALRLWWLVVALGDRSPLAVPAYLLTVLVLAATVGAFGWALHLGRARLHAPLPLAAAVLWTATEWLHAHLGPFAFPWLPLGSSLAPFPRLAGAADLAGVAGLSFWLAAASGSVATVVLRARAARPVGPALGTMALVVLAPAAYGIARAATLDLRPAARVTVVQPDVDATVRRDTAIALDSALAALTALTALVPAARDTAGAAGAAGSAEGGVDLVVWPEVAVPAPLNADRALTARIAALSGAAGAPILTGAYALERGGGPIRAFNAAFLVAPSGPVGRRYDKRVLVPFVERVPFLPDHAGRADGEARWYGGLEPGDAGPVHRLAGGARFGILLCYESAFPGLARAYRRGGADFLVALSNDAWFGRDAWWGRTPALWQHPAHLVLRAIETRAGVARAANTGFSMIIDPIGRIQARAPLFEPAIRTAPVMTTDARTLYTRWGDWLRTAALLLALSGLALAILHPRLLRT